MALQFGVSGIMAEVAAAPELDRRRWLERAANYLRPAAEAGRLTRFQREVLLGSIKAALSALSVSRGSATTSASNP